jgi:8-oxo-dGTP pyrophosphatase MutT (NUDIX family)
MENLSFALIQRPEYDGIHSGQISLPGGRYEEMDGQVLNTALRESKEEVGIEPGSVEIIGKLSELYIPPSNFMVYPFVGYTPHRPLFRTDKKEVQRLIETDLDDLLNDNNIKTKVFRIHSGIKISTPCYEIKGDVIWGATAMMLSEFREVIRRIRL